jgi:hypothetical protein
MEYPDVKNNLAPLSFSDKSLEQTLVELKKNGMSPELFYKLNSHHLRSEDFSKDHEGLHVLFAGCSVTAGEGLPLDMTWSKILYDRLSKEYDMSGYYNIAQPGATPIGVLHQTITYIGEFSKPDVIFLNLPDIDRENRLLMQGNENDEYASSVATGMQIYGYYMLLLDMCNSLGIKLIAFTWDDLDAKTKVLDMRKNFKRFFRYSKQEMLEYMFKFELVNREHYLKDYFQVAMDGSHPGISYHTFYADFAYNIFRRNNDY